MHKSQPANLALSCLVILSAIALSSCSKQTTPVANQPSATPEPKMEGQSANWKLTVLSVDKVPRQARDMFSTTSDEGPEHRFDTLQLTVDLTYTGAAGNVQSPAAALMDSKDQRIAALKAAIDTPGAIYMMIYGPGYSALRTIITDMNRPTPEAAEKEKTDKAMKELLAWVDPQVEANKTRTRALSAGEKLTLIYYFQDPNEYTNLRLAFADVPPITLHVKRDEKQATSSPSPAQASSPTPLNANAQGESKNWKVIVTSVKKFPNDKTDASQPRDSVEVRLELVYAGPPRAVGPPTADLIDGKGGKYAGDIRSTTVMRWVFPDGPPQVGLKPGDNLSVTFSFKDPKDDGNLKLNFMDVPTISLPAPQEPDPEN